MPLLMVLIAPAPGETLISTAATRKVSQAVSDIDYAPKSVKGYTLQPKKARGERHACRPALRMAGMQFRLLETVGSVMRHATCSRGEPIRSSQCCRSLASSSVKAKPFT